VTPARLLACVFVLVALPQATHAQTIAADAVDQTRPYRPPPPARVRTRPIGLRAYGFFDLEQVTARNTFTAVLGTDRLQAPGGGLEVLRLSGNLFVRGAFSTMKKTGSRVAAANDASSPLDIPLTVQMAPIEVAAGWRFESRRARRAVPYVGGGYLRLHYQESSSFANEGDDTNTWFNGYLGFAGVDVSIWHLLMAGVEAQYRTLPNTIGAAGASQVFHETDLGGTSVRVMIGIRK
jgi:hypothetical protein